MKLDVTGVDVWIAKLKDTPGMLYEKLIQLADSGADLDFVFALGLALAAFFIGLPQHQIALLSALPQQSIITCLPQGTHVNFEPFLILVFAILCLLIIASMVLSLLL